MDPRDRSESGPEGRDTWRPTLVVLAVVLAVAVAAVALPVSGGSTATDGRPLASCTTVDEPGRYVLAANLTAGAGDCLVVASSDVVLDGAGHVVETDGGVGVAVGTDDKVENVTVEDLRIQGGRDGVAATAVRGLQVRDVTATGQSRDGLRVDGGRDLSLSGVRVQESGRYGVFANVDGRTTVADVYLTGTRHEALEVFGETDLLVRNVTVSRVRGDEFEEPYDAVFVDVEGNVSIAETTVRNVPEGRGLYVYATPEGGTLEVDGVSVAGTRGSGARFGANGETNLSVTNATFVDVGSPGVRANGFDAVALRDSTVRVRNGDAVRVLAAEVLTVVDVRACGDLELDADERRVERLRCPDLTEYAGDDGVVDTGELQEAITDWARGRIDTSLLQAVIQAWASVSAVS